MILRDKKTPSLQMNSSDNQDGTEHEAEGHILTRYKPKVARPSFYKVILLNDDFTPMEFVIHVLKKFFNKDEPAATKVMLQVHHQGSGIAGVFSKEVAETKVYLVNEYSKNHRHPLKCVMEKDSVEPGG